MAGLKDRFHVHRFLGGGSFGAVYDAEDVARGERVAVKRLRNLDPTSLYQFKHEFRALADIAHPNLVRLHDLVRAGIGG